MMTINTITIVAIPARPEMVVARDERMPVDTN